MKMRNPIAERSMNGGSQRIYRFDNGYGASVVQSKYSYGGDRGLWELAVIRFSGDDALRFDLVYDTPVTDDVEGFLSWESVEKTLDEIEALPAKAGAIQ